VKIKGGEGKGGKWNRGKGGRGGERKGRSREGTPPGSYLHPTDTKSWIKHWLSIHLRTNVLQNGTVLRLLAFSWIYVCHLLTHSFFICSLPSHASAKACIRQPNGVCSVVVARPRFFLQRCVQGLRDGTGEGSGETLCHDVCTRVKK